ncbi:MAG TPA: 2-polyprenyl-3-methyl-6-methoxy-1,4-benzoquinone monooxygenase [Burkholderiales bacterium]|nr:2-polyprenyl-3-methyl-6-methoxy-1,4-benzoquinone monooxygenase [Burkholderiales bacterium]
MNSTVPSIDDAIIAFDKLLRTVAGPAHATRSNPADSVAEAPLGDTDRAHAAALMRVNHCGEVCAQALYQGQALASQNTPLKHALEQAAREEEDHLAWTEERIAELGGHTSLLNPLWYAGSLAIGFAAGKAGDAWNLGFLKETERQVEAHLQGHLDRLAAADARTRVVIEAMQRDEAGHARTAEALGARELPWLVKSAMRAAAKVMTTVSYRV